MTMDKPGSFSDLCLFWALLTLQGPDFANPSMKGEGKGSQGATVNEDWDCLEVVKDLLADSRKD